MRKFLLITFFASFLLSAEFVSGQYLYSFSQTTAAYSNLSGSTVVSDPVTPWTSLDPMAPVNLGFTFTYFTHPFTTLYPLAGEVGFGVVGSENFFIEVYDDFIKDRGTSSPQSPISYLVSGTTGNHIFKMEWKNFGFEDDVSASQTNYGNMQLWLFENGRIEFHFGSSLIDAGTTGSAETGLLKISNTDQEILYLADDPSAPTFMNYTVGIGSLTTFPANGTVYVFDPASATGIHKKAFESSVKVYPNPANEVLNISGPDIQNTFYSISDMTGKEVQSGKGLALLNVSELEQGMYMLKLQSDDAVAFKKFVIE